MTGKHTPIGPMPMGGVQSWMTTVKAELERLGHEVEIWEPGFEVSGFFDLCIAQHLKYTRPALNFCKRSVLISHGIIPDEKPEAGCDAVAFVSEGVRDHWGQIGPVIRQPINLDFWRPGISQRTHLTRYGYRKAPILRAEGWPYQHVHDASHEQARELLQGSACTYATGRAALEAMACGSPVVIYDHRSSYQGPLMGPRSLLANMKHSYSGRSGTNPSQSAVQGRTELAIEGGSQRAWVEEHHDSRKITEQIICFAS